MATLFVGVAFFWVFFSFTRALLGYENWYFMWKKFAKHMITCLNKQVFLQKNDNSKYYFFSQYLSFLLKNKKDICQKRAKKLDMA